MSVVLRGKALKLRLLPVMAFLHNTVNCEASALFGGMVAKTGKIQKTIPKVNYSASQNGT